MNNFKKIVLLLSFSLLGGCSFLQSFHSQSPEYIEVLIQEKQYSRAQNILQNINSNHTNDSTLQEQKKRLKYLSRKLENDTLAQLAAFKKQNEWQKAKQTLRQAQMSLPTSEILQDAEKIFIAARKKRINELNMQLDIHKGIWLRDAEPLLDAIIQTQPDNYERRKQQKQFKQEKSRSLSRLANCAKEAINAELYESGRHCLALVDKIDSEHKYDETLKQSRVKLLHHDHIWQQQQIKISDELLKELKQGYSHDNLLRASLHLQRLSRYKQTKETQQYNNRLRQELDAGIKQNMDAGRQLYSEGKITEALNIWTSLRKITLDNEALEAHISRAKRVLEKLEQLGNPLSDTPKTPAERIKSPTSG